MTSVQRRQQRSSRRQEEEGAQAYQGRRRPASGAFAAAKGDVASSRYLIECKETSAKSIRLTEDVLEKARREALAEGRTVVVRFRTANRRRWVVLEEEEHLELLALGGLLEDGRALAPAPAVRGGP